MENQEIRDLLKKEHIFMWQVAKELNIHESTLGRWFREPLKKIARQQVLSAIERIKLTKSEVQEDNE